jgi:hypothetical protein
LVDEDDRSIGNRELIDRAGVADHVVDVVLEPAEVRLGAGAVSNTKMRASVIRLPSRPAEPSLRPSNETHTFKERLELVDVDRVRRDLARVEFLRLGRPCLAL